MHVLLHEPFKYFGLRGPYRDALKPILKQIAALRRRDVEAKAKQYGLNMAVEADRLKAAEEVLAELAQTNPQNGFVKRAIAAIRTWLRENVPGFEEMGLTDDEIINSYLIPAREFVQRGARADANGVPVFQRVWHGSPHRFAKFSTAKIGSGEGAQAYGHGLYFSSRRKVAEWYKKTLETKGAAKPYHTFDGKVVDADYIKRLTATNDPELTEFLEHYSYLLRWGTDDVRGVLDKKIDRLKEAREKAQARLTIYQTRKSDPKWPSRHTDSRIANYEKEVADREKDIKREEAMKARITFVEGERKGQLYEVEIPEDDTFLLWDKPLSEQPKAVREAIGASENEKQTGRDYYHSKAASKGGSKAASEYLHSLGISGNKYLDGVSRSAGEGHYNYVVFRDDSAEIIQTYFSRSVQTDTPAFKKWFGDSKVVDENGKPLGGLPWN